jgi:hypothetical protein
MPNNSTARRWCFTLNNYTQQDIDRINGLSNDDRVRYCVIGAEVAASGTPHLQGYIELRQSVRIGGIKGIIGRQDVHVEKAGGTALQASEYCKKEGNVVGEFGVLGGSQGSRTDLSAVQEAIRSGSNLVDLAREHFPAFVKYSRGLQAAMCLLTPPRSWRTQCVWLWGPTGSGKSRRAARESEALCPGSVCWLPDQSLKWFDGYCGHKGIVLDDFTGTAELAFLLRLLDRYPLKVPVKGGFQEFVGRIVWITSNYSPSACYGGRLQFAALERRIDEVIHLE